MRKGSKHSIETRKKIALKAIGREISELTREKLKLARSRRVGIRSPAWKGGRIVTEGGYEMVRVEGHPRATKRGSYVLEHRHLMEQHLGRYLAENEVVDHKNGIKNDNRIENLLLFINQSEHIKTEGKRGKMKKSEEFKQYRREWAANRDRNSLGQFRGGQNF